MFPTIIGLLVIVPMIASFISSANQLPFLQRNPGTGPEMETLRYDPAFFHRPDSGGLAVSHAACFFVLSDGHTDAKYFSFI